MKSAVVSLTLVSTLCFGQHTAVHPKLPVEHYVRSVNHLTLEAALELTHRVSAKAALLDKKVSIAVLDASGSVVVLTPGDGVGPHNTEAARRKAFTALSTKTSTLDLLRNAAQNPDTANLNKNQAAVSQIIQFYYPDQQEFPPKKKDFIFDAEAFLYADNQFYIFTKNRSSAFDGTTALYRVKNVPGGRVAAEKISTFVTCGKYKGCAVTGAAISPDNTKVAILSSDKVWVFTGFKGDDFFSGKVQQIDLEHYSQKEGLCFEDNNTLLITDEGGKNERSKLYRLGF